MTRGGAGADPARRVAYEVLRAVSEQDAYANLVLPSAIRATGLSGRDAAFATELAYGTLRGRGSYDAVLATCVDRRLDGLDAGLLDALRLGAHQLLAMRVPAHAGVSQTVALVRAHLGHRTTGLANAVLRRVAAKDLAAWIDQVAPSFTDDPTGHRAVATSHPRWVIDSLAAALDQEHAGHQLDQLLAAHNTAPTVTLVARPGAYEPSVLRAETGGAAGRWSPYAVALPAGDPGSITAVRDRRVGVQDEGSQLAALAFAAATVSSAGSAERWLDLCAGPGGKAALLGGLAAARGARLVANDISAHRSDLVRQSVARLGEVVEVRTGDGRQAGALEPAGYDRVLVDVPCTGLGALRRRPEARWRREPGDVDQLVQLQGALLRSALDATRPGGVVAYSTCSPHLAETHGVVDRVCGERADAELLDVRPLLAGLDGQDDPDALTRPDRPTMQLWPHRHGTDAMFLALLRRT